MCARLNSNFNAKSAKTQRRKEIPNAFFYTSRKSINLKTTFKVPVKAYLRIQPILLFLHGTSHATSVLAASRSADLVGFCETGVKRRWLTRKDASTCRS
jgi:hypothetical protein